MLQKKKIASSQSESELGRPGISFLTQYVALDFQDSFPNRGHRRSFIRKEGVILYLVLA
jgi:hypothetical protein